MENFPTWADVAPDLIDTAAGRRPADLVISNARLANVHTREILSGWGVAVTQGRFAYVGPEPARHIGAETTHIDAEERLVIPGLCDGHMHIESGMLTPAQFASAVIPHGTTTMFTDPHEIANVMGLAGVRLMHDEAMAQPINIFTQMPSCAPSAPGLETTGHEIGPEDVAKAMTWPGIIGLGEMMNFPGVAAADAKMLAEMAATAAAGKVIGGHYASPDLGAAFHAYVAGGPADDHEGVAEADAVARLRQGMRAMLRLGSAWYDVEAQITAVTERGLDPRGVVLCTDDCHSGTLIRDGHMNRVLRHAIACGCDRMVALQMCTINTATHFGLERELGSIAPGRRADLILTDSLEALTIDRVFARGREVARGGALLVDCPAIEWPLAARNSVRLGRSLTAADFAILAEPGQKTARVRVIGVIENQAPTRALEAVLPVHDGMVEGEGDICQIALVERHRGTGKVTNGFVQGFGYQGAMAIASTVAHDSHHMITIGTDRASMAAASMRLAEIGGGITIFRDGQELALIELPIAGLMSDRPAHEVAADADKLSEAMQACGCTLNNAIMQHSLLALVVIPELRISDLGLVDVTRFALTELMVKASP